MSNVRAGDVVEVLGFAHKPITRRVARVDGERMFVTDERYWQKLGTDSPTVEFPLGAVRVRWIGED